MNTVAVKTSELIGHALGWAVAECLYLGKVKLFKIEVIRGGVYRVPVTPHAKGGWFRLDWNVCGPIIEREVESLYEHKPLECWAAKSKQGDLRYGPTPLIAAMRCYVASKLGDTVQIPEELAP